jgi:alpha-L-rhamnosidase
MMIKGLLLFFSMILFFASCISEKIKLTSLTCEYLTNPLGIDVMHPRFSWKIQSEKRGVYQKAYQLIISESLDRVQHETGEFWNSGKVISDQTVNLEYSGIPLTSNKKYYWRVCIWTDDNDSVWSSPVSFHTGLLAKSDWKAQWITTKEEILHESPVLRSEFRIEKKIKEAYAYISAGGFYEFFLNGEKVGDHVLDPGITDYRRTVLYSTYDVTRLIRKGDNAAGAMLGNGAFNMRKVEDRYSWGEERTFGNPCFIAQINVTYADGSQDVIVSDTSWTYTSGPVTFNNLYGGEDYDARMELRDWNKVGFDDNSWSNAVLADHPGGTLKSQLMPPIRVTATLNPVAETNPEPGVYLFDLGQNIAGWWRLQLKGASGQTIRIRGAETLNDSLFPKPLETADKLSTKFRYHSHTWTDYTLKGDEVENYEPHFFYTGFRYIEVTTSNRENLDILRVEGRVVRSALEQTGSFVSSDSLLNQIHLAGQWSQMGNTFSYPTDCPHREKGAYNGDGQVIAETAMHDFQMASFYTKWLNDMRDSQEENGRIPNTSPTLVGGMGGGVAWGSAYILIPWWMNHYYQDIRVLKDHYTTMKKYIFYLKSLGEQDEKPDEPFIINYFDGYWYSLGEWCSPGRNDCPNHAVINTFYYYYNTRLMSKIAATLGKKGDAWYFSALSDSIGQAFNEKFFNSKTSLYGTDETYQTYQLIALTGDLVPSEHRQAVFNTIVKDLNKRKNHLNTGIIGTKYLWPALVNNGQGNLAFEVARQTTYPSYGYWLKNGSTTLLEEWSGANSHNHQMFGSISEYFYKYLAGIRSPMENNTSAGYKHIHFQPFVPDSLKSVKASLETVSGTIVSDWKKEEGSFSYHVSIPANTTGTVVIPVFRENSVLSEGGITIWENGAFMDGVPGITTVKRESDRIMLTIESGEYKFELKE